MVDPVAGVQIVTPGLDLDQLGPVGMPEYDEIDLGTARQQGSGMFTEPIGTLGVIPPVARHPRRRPTDPPHEREREIGGRKPEEGAKRSASDRLTKHPIGALAVQKAVPVSHEGLSVRQRRRDRSVEQLDPDLLAEEAAGPGVVVSADETYPHARVDEVGEPTQYGEVAARTRNRTGLR